MFHLTLKAYFFVLYKKELKQCFSLFYSQHLVCIHYCPKMNLIMISRPSFFNNSIHILYINRMSKVATSLKIKINVQNNFSLIQINVSDTFKSRFLPRISSLYFIEIRLSIYIQIYILQCFLYNHFNITHYNPYAITQNANVIISGIESTSKIKHLREFLCPLSLDNK